MGDAKASKLAHNYLISSLSEKYLTLHVNSASDDHAKKEFWINTVIRLIYAADIVFYIDIEASENMLLERHVLQKVSLRKHFFDPGSGSSWQSLNDFIVTTDICRPSQIYVKITKRIFRKGISSFSYNPTTKSGYLYIDQQTHKEKVEAIIKQLIKDINNKETSKYEKILANSAESIVEIYRWRDIAKKTVLWEEHKLGCFSCNRTI